MASVLQSWEAFTTVRLGPWGTVATKSQLPRGLSHPAPLEAFGRQSQVLWQSAIMCDHESSFSLLPTGRTHSATTGVATSPGHKHRRSSSGHRDWWTETDNRISAANTLREGGIWCGLLRRGGGSGPMIADANVICSSCEPIGHPIERCGTGWMAWNMDSGGYAAGRFEASYAGKESKATNSPGQRPSLYTSSGTGA